MPATQVSPYLRRKISDEARMLLLSALGGQTRDAVNVRNLAMPQRIQNFRGQVRIEIPGQSTVFPRRPLRLRIIVLQHSYLIRCQLESREAEVSIYNKSGALTTWITLEDGQCRQLRTFVTSPEAPIEVCREVTCLLETLEQLDLFDLFLASRMAFPLPTSPSIADMDQLRFGIRVGQESFSGVSDKNVYTFAFDGTTGVPLSVAQRSLSMDLSPTGEMRRLLLIVEEYYRFDGGSIDLPTGIKSDMDLMIDIAMTCYSQWSYSGQQLMSQAFDAMDKDGDGCLSSHDVQSQLVAAGHSETEAKRIVAEMVRLLCDTNGDPLDEFRFYQFCGFWMIMLIDGYRISDPTNENQLVTAMQRLFFGD